MSETPRTDNVAFRFLDAFECPHGKEFVEADDMRTLERELTAEREHRAKMEKLATPSDNLREMYQQVLRAGNEALARVKELEKDGERLREALWNLMVQCQGCEQFGEAQEDHDAMRAAKAALASRQKAE